MKEKVIYLLKRFPYIDSVISLTFGGITSYLFQSTIDTWKQHGNTKDKVIISILLVATIIIMLLYYRLLYSNNRKVTALEKEKEKNEIQRLKDEREMFSSLYKQGTKAIEMEDLSIVEKAEIVKQINLVTNDNKTKS